MTPVLALLLALSSTGASSTAEPVLDRPTVPAAGRHAALLTIASFGRYGLTVASAQGTSLRLVDRMAGPGGAAGIPGERDGRLDLFLDRGEYRLITEGARAARGEARLAVHPFQELDLPRPPRLVELKPVEARLDDFQSRSYWLDVGERRTVALEAAGRNLADLRLWRDGEWLVDAVPETEIAQPVAGQPLLVCRLTARLEPGLYLLTAYGGPSQPWAEDSGEHPFHLRFGLPLLGAAGRSRHVVSPFGTDRYLVPGEASYFRVELPEARPATLQIDWSDPEHPFRNAGGPREITKKSLPPVAEEMTVSDPERRHVVTVAGAAGQPYVLQHFESKDWYRFAGSGDYWVSTVHSGEPEDSVDATAIVTRSDDAAGHVSPFLTQVVELDGHASWARRANLLAPLTVFFHVAEAGAYQIVSAGTEARFRFEPFMLWRPEHYAPPDYRGSGSRWSLDPGYYVLEADPVKKGILELTVRPYGLADAALDLVGLGSKATPSPVRASVAFPKVALDRDRSYAIYLNAQPDVRSGLVLRPLPLDLSLPLPLSPRPGEEISAPFRTGEPGRVRAEAEDGSPLEVSVDGGEWQPAVAVDAGEHTASVRNTRKKTVVCALRFEPRRLQADAPLTDMPDTALAAIPEFPVLSADSPAAFDLERGATATFRVRADGASLYRLESAGLLATEGNLRTRTVTSLAREAQNGVGRNFLVQDYLREGDYQVTVKAQGQSAGHLALRLSRTQLREGGFLTSFVPARISLAAGEAVAYHFIVTKPGEFRIRVLGLGREFHCRLEDEDGWPLLAPGGTADVTRYFEPGHYRFVLLPQPTEARALTLIEPTPRPRRFVGHGPHPLGLARRVEHVWLEPESGKDRAPDRWAFSVPADIQATVELAGEMQADLVRIADGGADTRVGLVPPDRGWKGPLAAGRYELRAVAARVNNRNAYAVAVWPEELLPGLSRDVAAPGDVSVALGTAGLVEIASFGSADVKASLYDADGRLLGSNDDRPDDWNFSIARSLSAGRYRLRVEPVGGASATCRVSARAFAENEEQPLALPAATDAHPGRSARLYPLTGTVDGGLLLAAARSSESVGLALETARDGAWVSLGSTTGRAARLAVPLPAAGPEGPSRYRLRLWSLDRRDSTVRLSLASTVPAHLDEAALAAGAPLTPIAGFAPAVAAAEVALSRPGVLVAPDDDRLLWSAAAGEACAAAPGGRVAASGRAAWVVAEVGASPPTVRARRLVAGPTDDVAIVLPSAPAVADLAPSDGGALALEVKSRAGQPGVRLREAGESPGRGGPMAVGERSALAVALAARHPVGVVWSADPADPASEVRLRPMRFPRVAPERAPGGTWEGAIDRARAFALPAGPKRLRLALGDDVVGVLSHGDSVLSIHWQGGAAFAETVESEADRLTLLHPGEGPGRFSAEALPLDRVPPPLAPGMPYQEDSDRAGVTRLAVAGAVGARLHVRGAHGDAVLVTVDGLVRRGSDLPAEAQGTVLVSRGPGVTLVWLDREGHENEDLWGDDSAPQPIEVRPPAALTLNGAVSAYRISLASPAMLHLRTAAPLVTLLRREQGAPEVAVHRRAGALDAYLPAGRAELWLRALTGATLTGVAEITTSPVTPVGEGLGPEVLLAPGATRLFSFTVPSERSIGVGVRASADVVETTLLSADGKTLGTGVVQMPVLGPGTYLLALHAPENGGPVRARPALAGLVIPSTGPPADVVRQYVESDAPPASVQGAPPPVHLAPWTDEPFGGDETSGRMRGIEPDDVDMPGGESLEDEGEVPHDDSATDGGFSDDTQDPGGPE